ncbi:MAG TPA: sigma-70 family RNA polymerase sigma factor [Polyangiaceae bacterium]|nr:sigma-70 family RNA polymerase sigma factor [Polyangiaceae bacterium]
MDAIAAKLADFSDFDLELQVEPEPTSRRTKSKSAVARPSLLPRPARRHEPRAVRQVRRPVSILPAALVPGPSKSPRISKSKRAEMEARRAQRLLEEFTPLVRKIAGGFQRKLPRNVLREDLIAAGMSGLWDAIRRHPDGGDESFEWYVRVRIRGAILDELRAQDWLPRRARAAAEANAGTDAYVPPPSVVRIDDVSEWEQNRCLADASSSESAVAAKFAQETLVKAVELLPERERHIVSSHYFRGVKFKDLGVELGVSEPRISQLHSRAIARLKELMASAA